MGKITIQRIAKELGFSRNTVSMALKGNDMVAPQTREMIRGMQKNNMPSQAKRILKNPSDM